MNSQTDSKTSGENIEIVYFTQFDSPNTVKAWLLFGISMVGMLIFAGLYFLSPRTVVEAQTVTNTVTNEIIRETPKEVQKTVRTPAEIPDEYVQAMRLYQQITNAPFVTQGEALFNLKDVQIQVDMSTDAARVTTEEELRAQFELGLQSNNVPINPNSQHILRLEVDGAFDETTHMLHYDVQCNLWEVQWLFRGGQCCSANVIVWRKPGWLGIVDESKANVPLLELAKREGGLFSMAYVESNPTAK